MKLAPGQTPSSAGNCRFSRPVFTNSPIPGWEWADVASADQSFAAASRLCLHAVCFSHEKIVEDNKPEYYLALRQSQRTFQTDSRYDPYPG